MTNRYSWGPVWRSRGWARLPESQETALAAILGSDSEVVLICWEHQHIPALVICTSALDAATGGYACGQVPQQLLEGDTDIASEPGQGFAAVDCDDHYPVRLKRAVSNMNPLVPLCGMHSAMGCDRSLSR